MSKECKQARNMVMSAMMILAILVVVMSMSSCMTSGGSCAAYTMSPNGTGGSCSR